MQVKLSDELTTGEAARALGVAIQTIHNWINSGQLQAREEYQGRKRVRFVRRDALEALRASLPSAASEGV